ncbi:unnamed protein product [Meloidogyne enterolobii]|uniref:Uncharacterized protein n=1 Tax=Meloidogyne enterolobii TaxID=390850 RepID=A0ACB0Y934_MELEN
MPVRILAHLKINVNIKCLDIINNCNSKVCHKFQSFSLQFLAQALEQACHGWWREAKIYGIPGNLVFTDAVFRSGVGHFTQMAWATTSELGCAVVRCGGRWRTYVVCQYNPRGNIINQLIYKRGGPCSQCGAAGCYGNGLCR